jgi:pimeloyl-ACP methyl ester carboxylesterase
VYSSLTHRFVNVNGVRLHIAEQGQGPLVLLLHGWPESWYSWRHQFGPLTAAGYRVVAPDQRGYARSEQPPHVTSYTLLHLVGDVIALIEELGEEQAVVVGHDWGAPVAWIAAMLRPDKVRAVAGLSILPILPGGMVPPSITRTQYGEGFYQIYFQRPGVADAEFARDIPTSFRRLLVGASGNNPLSKEPRPLVIPDGMGLLDLMPESPTLPAWLTEEDRTSRRTPRTSPCTARRPSLEPLTGTGTSNATTNCSRLSGGAESTSLRCTWWETVT